MSEVEELFLAPAVAYTMCIPTLMDMNGLLASHYIPW